MSNELANASAADALSIKTMDHEDLVLGTLQDIDRNFTHTGNLYDAQVFLALCRASGANPYKREIYSCNIGGKQTTMISYAHQIRMAQSYPTFRGLTSGVVVASGEPQRPEEREGCSFWPELGDVLLGAHAEVYVEGVERPYKAVVRLKEYKKRGNWDTMPATMIEKVAIARALRFAYPGQFGGMYIPEEMDQAQRDAEPQPDNRPAPTQPSARDALMQDAGHEWLAAVNRGADKGDLSNWMKAHTGKTRFSEMEDEDLVSCARFFKAVAAVPPENGDEAVEPDAFEFGEEAES